MQFPVQMKNLEFPKFRMTLKIQLHSAHNAGRALAILIAATIVAATVVATKIARARPAWQCKIRFMMYVLHVTTGRPLKKPRMAY